MILKILTQDALKKGVYYSRWHSIGRKDGAEWVRYYDLGVGELVVFILSDSENKTFIVATYLTDLVSLDVADTQDTHEQYYIWTKDAGTMYLEDKQTGIRYNGYIEGIEDLGDEGLKVLGGFCMFTESMEESYVETWCKVVEFYHENLEYIGNHQPHEKLNNLKDFIENWEDFIRENYPEKILGVKL